LNSGGVATGSAINKPTKILEYNHELHHRVRSSKHYLQDIEGHVKYLKPSNEFCRHTGKHGMEYDDPAE
jgi:hypothetical protein